MDGVGIGGSSRGAWSHRSMKLMREEASEVDILPEAINWAIFPIFGFYNSIQWLTVWDPQHSKARDGGGWVGK